MPATKWFAGMARSYKFQLRFLGSNLEVLVFRLLPVQ